MTTGNSTLDEQLEKLERLAADDVLVFHFHNGKAYLGEDHVPRSKAVTVADIEAAYAGALGKKASSHPDYLEPAVVLEVLNEAIRQEAIANLAQARANGRFFDSVTDFVKYWLGKLDLTLDNRDLMHVSPEHFIGVLGEKNTVGTGMLVNFLKIKLSEYNHHSEEKDLKREDVQAVLEVELYRRRKDKLATVRKNLKYASATAPYTQKELFQWARGLLAVYFVTHGENGTVRDADVIALLHMLWQIKRKVYSLPIESELIYSFYSMQQNMGKTHLVKQLASPVDWAYDTVNVSEVLDPNARIARCREKFVIDMIELAKVEDRSDNVNAVAALFKSLVSNTGGDGLAVHSLRGFHTQSKIVEEQTTVFVTTTNIKIATVIQDTDMRRFWEFVLTPPRGFDPDFFFNANVYLCDIEDIYRSIDENCRFGYYHQLHPEFKEMYGECRVIQKNMSKSNALSEWLDLQGIVVSSEPEEGYTKMSIKAFHRKFQSYKASEGCESRAFTPFYITSILANVLGVEPEIEMINGVATKMIYVKGVKK